VMRQLFAAIQADHAASHAESSRRAFIGVVGSRQHIKIMPAPEHFLDEHCHYNTSRPGLGWAERRPVHNSRTFVAINFNLPGSGSITLPVSMSWAYSLPQLRQTKYVPVI